MRLSFQYNDDLIVLDIQPEGETWRVRLPDGAERRIQVHRLPEAVLHIAEVELETAEFLRAFRVPFARTANGIELSLAGQTYTFSPAAARHTAGGRGAASGHLIAPMGGTVIDVFVSEGERVEAYQPLAIIEAMKVMATVEAPFAGTVQAVHVAKGRQVGHNAPVVDIVPASGESEVSVV
jgi:biotin carboxyl carrier protein